MTPTNPVQSIEGTETGNICDGCNRGLRTGDQIRLYATKYDDVGWDVRRVWCPNCGSTAIETGTDDADELVAKAVFFQYRIVAVEVLDRSRPTEGVR